MKQLYFGDKPTSIFFEKNVKMKDVVNWVNRKLIYSDNIFDLNEQHSCKAINIDNTTIVISGDEDYKEIELVNVQSTNPNEDYE
jgi:hypothetical protein